MKHLPGLGNRVALQSDYILPTISFITKQSFFEPFEVLFLLRGSQVQGILDTFEDRGHNTSTVQAYHNHVIRRTTRGVIHKVSLNVFV